MFEEKQTNLQSLLMKTIQEKGFVEAVEVCNLKMQANTQDSNPRIRRVSDLNRNPSNAPTDSELKIIQKWKSDLSQGKEIEPTIFEESQFHIVMKPIVLQNPTCLNCHGTSINPEVENKIKSLYPNDKAIGYKLGDLRGAFVAYWKK